MATDDSKVSDDSGAADSAGAGKGRVWPQVRRLLVFQLKLYVDAFRDLLMSPVSVVAVVVDVLRGRSGKDSHFEDVMRFGRETEKAINLFNQHDTDNQEACEIDRAISQVQESIRRHYEDGTLTEKTRQTLESTLNALRTGIQR